MSTRALSLVLFGLTLSCGSEQSTPSAAGPSGGSPGTGGTSGMAGTSSNGGASGAGGASSTAGATGSGGSAGASAVDECASPKSDWVFCSGFEEGNKSIWDDYDGNPDSQNLLMSDPGPKSLQGNHVMRFRVAPGRGGADLVKLLPPNDKLYARWYIKYEAGFDFAAPNHGGGLHAGSRDLLGRSDYRPSGSDWFTGWVEHTTDTHVYNVYSYYRGMYMDCADPNGQCWGDHFPCMADQGQTYCTQPIHRPGVVPPVLATDRWYCVELMMDAGTPSQDAASAAGTLDFWVDGKEIGPWTKLWYRTTADLKLGILWLNLFHHGDHSVAGVFYDNVVVSRSPVGCW
jgi:hypothetical protein